MSLPFSTHPPSASWNCQISLKAWHCEGSPHDMTVNSMWLQGLGLKFEGETYEPGSKLLVLGMVIQPLIGNPYNGYINPYYWVDDHPLLYGNNGSLDPSTYWKCVDWNLCLNNTYQKNRQSLPACSTIYSHGGSCLHIFKEKKHGNLRLPTPKRSKMYLPISQVS